MNTTRSWTATSWRRSALLCGLACCLGLFALSGCSDDELAASEEQLGGLTQDHDAVLGQYGDGQEGPAPCPGGPGCPCTGDDECSGICLETPTGMVCSQSCDKTCPEGFACLEELGAAGDTIYVCAWAWGRLCEPCQDSAMCQAAIGAQDAVCVTYGGVQGSFCGAACEGEGDCPAGYACGEANSIEGTTSKQCLRLPDENGDVMCPCDWRAVDKKLTTMCANAGPAQACPGSRWCEPDGTLTKCTPFVDPEICDGKDNDCNGLTDDLACDDKNPCTDDLCDIATGSCGHTNNTSACDDGDACTQQEACNGEGTCQGGQAVDCDDGNPCTQDTCDPTLGCGHEPLQAPCDDGNPCTESDGCQDGKCAAGVAKTCDDGNVCTDDACDAATGECQHLVNTVPCDDGNECTLEDKCSQGNCVYGINTCTCKVNADCAVKEDGNFCNGTLYCDKSAAEWACVIDPATVVKCDGSADSVCASNVCNPLTGKCGYVVTNEGGACDADGSGCTVGDSCQGGVCMAGALKNCDDGNECTKDSCNAELGCQFSQSELPCSDGNGCTSADVCKGGICTSGTVLSCDDGNQCTDDFCDPIAGKCVYKFKVIVCDDGNACSQDDTCQDGTCTGTPVACSDGNPCTSDSCSAQDGCVHAYNTLPCNDGNACSTGDVCAGGVCKGAKAIAAELCDDGNECTTDTCDAKLGCKYANNVAPCDDGNTCTQGDTCSNGACQSGANECKCVVDSDCKDQEDGNLCNGTLYCDKSTAQYTCKIKPSSVVVCDGAGDTSCGQNQCNPANGQCSFVALNEGKPCDADGSVCTEDDTCLAGKCVAGQLTSCNDGNPCTNDVCDAVQGCGYTNNTVPCSDGNPCTVGDVCKNSVCVFGQAQVCDDGNACTNDTCDQVTGKCVFAPNANPCDDNNACTQSDGCAAGLCAGASVKCDDGNPCTNDSCNPASGCVNVANNLACDDGDACSQGDLCQGGACKGQPVAAQVLCDDGNPCTTDSCSAKLGCQHANNTVACDDGNGCTTSDTCSGGKCVSGTNTCGCVVDADCIPEEDGNLCNGTLYCDKSVPGQYKCTVNPKTVVSCDASANSSCAQNLCDKASGKCGLVPTNEGKSCDADASVCSVGDVCKAGACQPGAKLDCDDSNPCSNDTCDAKLGCVSTPNTSPCTDGNPCTVGDACKNNGCVPGLAMVCSDDNPCTIDACDVATGKCVFKANDLACDDGNACSQNDQCANGVCAGSAVQCDDGNLCTNDSCDPKVGCTYGQNTVPCNDGNACTEADACAGGTCKGQATNAAVLCNDNNPCTTDSCDPKAGCVYTPNTAACDDGNGCTVGDVCSAGKCASGTNTCGCTVDADCATQEDGDLCNGTLYCDKAQVPYKCQVNPKTVVTCDASANTTCVKNQCDKASGKCAYTPINEGKACDADGSVCTVGDACKAGSCAAGSGLQCDDGNPCTNDLCNATLGCSNVANGSACNDGNPCSAGDVCQNSACVPGKALVCDDGNACTSDSCDKATGKCVFAANTTPCDDGNACSQADTCSGGLCLGASVKCDDGNPCTNDSCNPQTGCVNAANTVACNDGNACTQNDLCASGTCKGTAANATTLCNDNNPCTTDSCDTKLGCVHTNNTASCDDGNGCTVGDVCGGGKCVSGSNTCGCASDLDCGGQEDGDLCNGTLFCDKSALPYQCKVNPKTVVTCDTAGDTACIQNQCDKLAGKCGYAAINEGKPCDADGSVCTVGDVCKSGGCTQGATMNCDDGNPCSTDACDAKLGCTHQASAAPCTDGNACTVGDSCQNNACLPGPAMVCDDGNACTTDKCDTATGKCVFANNTNPCDDGNACTTGDVCGSGLCTGASAQCNDGNVCTNDSCDPKTGCVNTPNAVACSDGNACTENDVCASGTCKGASVSAAVLCTDNNPCTTDTCDSKAGCVHTNNAATCDDGNGCTVGDVCSAGKCTSGSNTCGCTADADCAGQEDGDLCNGTLFCDKAQVPYSCKVKPLSVVTCDGSGDTPCLKNQCDKAQGKCAYTPVNEAKPCDADGSVCSVGDACKSGVCTAGAALNCDDGNPCSADACSPTLGCTHQASTAPCSDGNPCTVGDVCQNNACVPGPAQQCNDGNACTTDKCDGATGKCVNTANTLPCDDGNACTQADACAAAVCAGQAVQCNDGNVCTNDSCDPKTGCVNTKNTVTCDDGNACTSGDACSLGVCKGSTIDPATACSDNNPCTTDACDGKVGCVHTNNSSTCNDGNACTTGDICSAGKCVSGNNQCGCTVDADCADDEDGNLCNGTLFCDKASLPYQCKVKPTTVVTCDGSADTACQKNQCTPATGKCGYVAINEGKPCNADSSVCTVSDVCAAGVCKAGSTLDCNDNNACSDDWCDAALGCKHAANAAPCSDGSACTVGDKCTNNACVPGAVQQCNDGNPCTADSCDQATGKCVYVNNTTTCDDGNACTQGDTCAAGACTGQAVQCGDGNPCTNDTCNSATGCVNTPNTLSCSDGNACTSNDQCSNGACKGSAVDPAVQCDDGNACTNDGCSPSVGCVHVNNSNPCTDGNACTSGDVCSAGKCVSGSNQCGCTQDTDCAGQEDGNLCNGTLYCDKAQLPYNCKVKPGSVVTCDASFDGFCSKNTCNPSTGACAHVSQNEAKACDADGSVCSAGDKCTNGTCMPGAFVTCNDNNPCTDDSCNPVSGCVYKPNTVACTDNNPCTLGDLCSGGACVPGAVKDCNDSNACTDDSCNVATGQCSNATSTKICDDGNACTQGDKCGGGACVGGALNCDDGNPCTSDSCSPTSGCVNTPNTLACTDNNACTDIDKCANGLCTGSSPKTCNDGNPCTTDSCNPATGCVYAVNSSPCDDGNACTDNDTCANKACTGQAATCNDGNVCTSDSCNPSTGCVFAANSLPCSDGTACTQGDVCVSGACKAGATLQCDDGNPCTNEACDTKSGCIYVNNTAACSDGNGCTVSDTCSGGVCLSGANQCGCTADADCIGQEDGNACNGKLFCDKAALPYKCKVNPATVVTCDDSLDNACQKNTCQTGTGACVMTPINENMACDADGSVCTPSDICKAGKCTAGTPLNCSDGNVCTNDVCDPATGCQLTPNNATCSDGNACSVGDQCSNGACVAGVKTVCDDGNVCTVDSCNTTTGACVFNPTALQGTSCDADGSLCTANDTCQSGKCTSGPVLNCDDNNICTTDSCKPASGCSNVANSNLCNDNDACTAPDVCAGGACKPPAINCDDQEACTTDTCDKATGCKHVTAPDKAICGPTSICWSGKCTPGKCGDTVVTAGLGEKCDDGNTFNGDGCSATCIKEDPACADGTREGNLSIEGWPEIAQCAGNWSGSIAGTGAAALCGTAYHVCSSYDKALMQSIPQWVAMSPGCWAVNATNHGGGCAPCDDKSGSNNMAGIGSSCPSVSTTGSSCVSPDYKIDSGTSCSKQPGEMPWLSGVLCCKTY